MSEEKNATKETKLCKHCQSEMPKAAKVCPTCRKKQGGALKWIIIIVILLILGLAFCGGSDTQDTTKTNGTSGSTVEEIEYMEITSTELIDAYNENQVKCKQDYDGKDIKVTGTVISVGTDVLGNVYVCLGSDSEFTIVGVQCYAKDEETENKIAELKEGDVITVVGEGSCGSLSFTVKKAEIIE